MKMKRERRTGNYYFAAQGAYRLIRPSRFEELDAQQRTEQRSTGPIRDKEVTLLHGSSTSRTVTGGPGCVGNRGLRRFRRCEAVSAGLAELGTHLDRHVTARTPTGIRRGLRERRFAHRNRQPEIWKRLIFWHAVR